MLPPAKSRDGGGNGKDRACEDDGENAGHVDLNGQVGVLSAVHLSADHTLGILNRNSALGAGHKDDEGDDSKEQHADSDNGGCSYR